MTIYCHKTVISCPQGFCSRAPGGGEKRIDRDRNRGTGSSQKHESESKARPPAGRHAQPQSSLIITETKYSGVSSRALSFPFLEFGRARSGHAPWRTSSAAAVAAASGGRMRRIPNCAPSWSSNCMLSSTLFFPNPRRSAIDVLPRLFDLVFGGNGIDVLPRLFDLVFSGFIRLCLVERD